MKAIVPATTEIKSKIDACRAILGCTNEPQGKAWNQLTAGYRAALLKVAELPLNYRHDRWEELSISTQNRIIHAAIDSEGLRRFLDAVRPMASTAGETMQ